MGETMSEDDWLLPDGKHERLSNAMVVVQPLLFEHCAKFWYFLSMWLAQIENCNGREEFSNLRQRKPVRIAAYLYLTSESAFVTVARELGIDGMSVLESYRLFTLTRQKAKLHECTLEEARALSASLGGSPSGNEIPTVEEMAASFRYWLKEA